MCQSSVHTSPQAYRLIVTQSVCSAIRSPIAIVVSRMLCHCSWPLLPFYQLPSLFEWVSTNTLLYFGSHYNFIEKFRVRVLLRAKTELVLQQPTLSNWRHRRIAVNYVFEINFIYVEIHSVSFYFTSKVV